VVERHLRERAQLTDAEIGRAVKLALEDPGGLDLQQVIDTSAKRAEWSESE